MDAPQLALTLDDPYRGASFSPCGRYRYQLHWIWLQNAPLLCYVLLNPSIADATRNDPTFTRCAERARRLGYGGVLIVNLYAFISTDPAGLLAVEDPIGPDADRFIVQAARRAGLVVCGWGTDGGVRLRHRPADVLKLLEQCDRAPHVLRLTKGGHPEHPLYLPYRLEPHPWPQARSTA